MNKQDLKVGDLIETVLGDRMGIIIDDLEDVQNLDYNFVVIYVFDKEDTFAINRKRIRKLS